MKGSDEDKQIRDLINDMDAVPGAEWNTNAVWERFQIRKQHKTNKPERALAYGIAAAALLTILSIIPFWNNQENKPTVYKTQKALSDNVKQETPEHIVLETVTGGNNNNNKTPQKHIALTNRSFPEEILTIDTLVTHEEEVAVLFENSQITDSFSQQATPIIAEKKRMKVIHINDVSNEVLPPSIPAKQESFFGILYPNSKSSNTASASEAGHRTSSNRFKIKSNLEN